jgi:hypothetical protein
MVTLVRAFEWAFMPPLAIIMDRGFTPRPMLHPVIPLTSIHTMDTATVMESGSGTAMAAAITVVAADTIVAVVDTTAAVVVPIAAAAEPIAAAVVDPAVADAGKTAPNYTRKEDPGGCNRAPPGLCVYTGCRRRDLFNDQR